MKRKGKRIILIVAAIILIMIIGVVVFALVGSYRMSLIPSMTFEEMMRYTTENNEDAVITVGIIKNGEMNYVVYGENAVILPEEEFEYEVGSATKTFTCSLLSKAMEEGKVKLTDSINQYIELPNKDYYPNFTRLVTHTSGYKGYYFEWQMASNFMNGEENDFYGINSESLKEKIGEISLENKDYKFNYSNFGIAAVGSALAKIYGSDFTTLMNDFIASDLKLEDTVISDGTGNLKGYWNWKPQDAYIPAGAIVSDVSDMMQYVKLHMTEELPYLARTHEALAQVDATTKQYSKMGIRIDAVGMGWMLDTQNNIIWHNGGTSNFNSYIAFDKEKQVGVVILSNLPPNYRIPATVMGVKLITTLQDSDK